jgi:RimJ/RimL family protein N-acetyltransferase
MYKHKDGISFRKIEEHDLKRLLILKQESWWGTHKTLFLNMDDQKKWYETIPSNELYLIGYIDPNNTGVTFPIGIAVYTDIDWISRSLKISGSIYREYRSNIRNKAAFAGGLDFAFEVLNMQRVEAEVIQYHVAAQKLEIDYLGFKVEGIKRKAVYKSGVYYDSIILGLLREEWEKQGRVLAYGGSCNCNIDHAQVAKLIHRFSPTHRVV